MLQFNLTAAILVFFLGSNVEADSAPKLGMGSAARFDKDIKLNVPDDLAVELYKYLQTRYQNPQVLSLFDPGATYREATEIFVDIYYDTRDHRLFKAQGDLRHRRRYSSQSEKLKEWIQFKFPSTEAHSFTEKKFEVKDSFAQIEEKCHTCVFELKTLPKKREFERLESSLKSALTISAHDLLHALTITQTRQRVYVEKGEGNTQFTVTLDNITAEKWWWTAKFYELEIEINEKVYSGLGDSPSDQEQRQRLNAQAEGIMADILRQFPRVVVAQGSKYSKAFTALEQKIPYFHSALWLQGFFTGY